MDRKLFNPLISPAALWPSLCCAGAVALLAACATPRPTDTAVSGAAPPPAERAPATVRAAPSRGGGYYLDDGPGDNPPPDLDAIPDAEPKLEPLHRYANNPYSVFGRDYVPERKLAASRKRGVGSWYGRRFHGQKTSSGEPYDMYAMTAAHPTLPIPSYVRVTNPANNRSIVVRVNDRGPFHAGRIIDLSYTAAWKLGYVQQGSTLLEVESLVPGGPRTTPAAMASAAPARPLPEPARSTPVQEEAPDALAELAAAAEVGRAAEVLTANAGRAAEMPAANAGRAAEMPAANAGRAVELPTANGGGTWLQLAAFSSQDGAESFGARVRAALRDSGDKLRIEAGGGSYRLQLGPYASAADAERMARRVREAFELKPMVVRRGT